MIKYIIITFIVGPPIAFLILYANITKQLNGQSKVDAQRDVRHALVRNGWFWTYVSFLVLLGLIYSNSLSTVLRWLT